MSSFFRALLLSLVCVSYFGCQYSGEGTLVYVENQKVRLGFDAHNGALVLFDDLLHSQSLLDTVYPEKSPWQINFHTYANDISLDMSSARNFSFEKTDKTTLTMYWRQFTHTDFPDLCVKIAVRLDKKQPLSYWKIHLSGIEGKPVESVIFPRISGFKEMGEEYLAVSNWTGSLLKNPRHYLPSGRSLSWSYPGALSMQMLALYHPEKTGFYASCNDSLSYKKDFVVCMEEANQLMYQMNNYPEYDPSKDDYSLEYEAVIGSFKGDWLTAAELYRNWAHQQKWCRESRLKNGLVPLWVQETALWVWNRGKSPGVLDPAIELKKQLGAPVSVLWHWWHGCSYDDGFPEYVPPREGRAQLIQQVAKAREQGVRAIVYMNQIQWGNATESYQRENATLHTIKDVHGAETNHVYNIFSGKALTLMCIGTDFWKNKYASLADTVVNQYHVGGIYMDQTCLSYACYDPEHGHPLGGGNFWVEHSGRLSSQIRALTKGKESPALAGEGSGESWLPHLDLFLTLEVSRERYMGISAWETIPLFQAVYHPYAVSFGSYSSLLHPPYDELWPSEFAPKDTLQLLDEKYNDQFLIEQARSFVWGSQPMIANYRSFLETARKPEMDFLRRLAKVRMLGLKYLLHGQYVRLPEIASPKIDLKISRLSIYAGRAGNTVTELQGVFPVIYASAWKAADGTLGIPIVNIGNQIFPLKLQLKAKDYDLPASGKIYLLDETGKKFFSSYQKGVISIYMETPPKGISIIEIGK